MIHFRIMFLLNISGFTEAYIMYIKVVIDFQKEFLSSNFSEFYFEYYIILRLTIYGQWGMKWVAEHYMNPNMS